MFIKKATLCPGDLIEEIFLNKELFTILIQNLSRILSFFGNEASNDCQVRFICLEDSFQENLVFGKNINSSITCLRIQWVFFFSDLERNRAFGRKVSAWLPKPDSTLPNCLIKEIFFFGWKNVFRLFSDFWRIFFSDSCKEHRKIVKLLFYLSRATSPCEIFFLE